MLHIALVVLTVTTVMPPVTVVVLLPCRMSPCCPLPSFCRFVVPPIAVVMPTVALLPVAVVVPPVAVVLPRCHAAHHHLCSLAANWRNCTKPRHSGVAHDAYMERLPLDMQNEGRRCEYNDINDHDVVMSEIPWLCAVVDGSTLPYSILI
jgi:hypothetical protein